MITLPPPSKLARAVHAALQAFLRLERRFEPFFRPALNALLREPTARFVQFVMNMLRRDEGFKLAEERALPNEEASLRFDRRSLCDLYAAELPPGRI